jgi:hypothetical protein
MGILGENPQDLEGVLGQPFNHLVSIRFAFLAVFVRELSIEDIERAVESQNERDRMLQHQNAANRGIHMPELSPILRR